MSSRGRPPKNGTPFDRLLKKQCQKGVSASKSAGIVGKWGATSFTSIRSASIPSEQVSRPKKFFKSKNTSESDYGDPMIQTQAPAPPPAAPKAPSKFFKSKNVPSAPSAPPAPVIKPPQPVVTKPVMPMSKQAPLRPLEVTSNNQPVKEPKEDVMKVPPLKLRLKAGTVIPPAAPASTEASEESDVDSESVGDAPDSPPDDPEISFKEPSLVIQSPPKIKSPEKSPLHHTPPRVAVPVAPVQVPSPVRKSPEPPPALVKPKVPEVQSKPSENNGFRNVPARSYTRKKPLEKEVDKPLEMENNKRFKVEEAEVAEPVIDFSAKTTLTFEEPKFPTKLEKSQSVITERQPELKSEPMTKSESMPPPASATGSKPAKKSFFKSKKGDSNAKKASYKHSFGNVQEVPKDEEFKQKVFQKAISMDFDMDDQCDAGPSDISFRSSLTKVTSNPDPDQSMSQEVTSVKCPKAQKEYYTVIKKVKAAHQIQDSGEFQEFNDDVEYILDGLHKRNNLPTRCLSTVTLATKCMEPPFRMHLRAHGTMNKFFAELRDAPQNPGLALCTSTVLFVLSQDRLNMDMDRDSLELMLNLLDTDSRMKDLDSSGMSQRELAKNKQKVQELCAAMKAKGHAVNLSLENISADHLSMETLLSLTSKRAGEWFKEELRELGGLDHLVRTMKDCISYLLADEISMWTESLHNKLRKAGRVLKVLESVTHENEENCQYLLKFEKGEFLDLIHKLFKLLDEEVPLNPQRDNNDKESICFTLRESLFDVMRVYINLVHDYNDISLGSKMSGEKSDTFDIVLHCLLVMPDYVPVEKRFDILVLTLTLLINLVEHCEHNRTVLLKSPIPLTNDDLFAPGSTASENRKTAGQALVQMFLENEENAKREESKTDAILDNVKGPEDTDDKQKDQKTEQEAIDETVAKLLQKAGRHMEDTLIASYVTLIIGYLIKDNKEHEATIREFLPDANYSKMVTVLKKFYNFMNLTASSTVASNRGIKATEMILKTLEKVDAPEVKKEEAEENFDDLTLFEMTKDESSISLQAPEPLNMSMDSDDFDKL